VYNLDLPRSRLHPPSLARELAIFAQSVIKMCFRKKRVIVLIFLRVRIMKCTPEKTKYERTIIILINSRSQPSSVHVSIYLRVCGAQLIGEKKKQIIKIILMDWKCVRDITTLEYGISHTDQCHGSDRGSACPVNPSRD
jgi:hypothetical protein